MKPNFMFLLVLSMFLTAFTYPVGNSTNPSLYKSQVGTFNEESLALVRDYYGEIGVITGNNIDSSQDQNALIDNIESECFRSSEVVINNNIPAIAQDNLEVKQYLKSILVFADKIENINTDPHDLSTSAIYFNSKDNYYYLVVTAKQNVSMKNSKSSSIVDFYINFNTENGLKPKIYSVQNHQDGILATAVPVTIADDEQSATSVGKGTSSVSGAPCFLFDITPNIADIIVDGKNVLYDGLKIHTTPGDHVIELSAINYQDLKFGVHADDTGDIHITRRLTPKQGYLFVNSTANTPQDLQVFIDSNMVGQAPLNNYQLNVGHHFLEVKNSNGFYKSYNVSVTDDNATTLTVQSDARGQWQEKKDIGYGDAPPSDVSYQAFYDALSPYGQWVEDPQYGNVWVPNDQTSDFTPYYSNGHWEMTDVGNAWVSNDPWGWACYHYGRWTYNSYYNWVWVPGYQWAPAWVTWRSNNNYCGWAPMAPGIPVGVGNGCPDSWWVFVGYNHVYDPSYRDYRVNTQNNVVYVRQTSVITNTVNSTTINNTKVNSYYAGPSQSAVQAATHRNFPVYHIATSANPVQPQAQGSVIGFYKPSLQSTHPYVARPSSVVVSGQSISDPQQIAKSGGRSFKQDLQNNKIEPRRNSTSPLERQSSQQQGNQRVIQPVNQVSEQQRIQQQRTQTNGGGQSSQQQNNQQNSQRPQQQSTLQEQQRIQQQAAQQQQTQQAQTAQSPTHKVQPSTEQDTNHNRSAHSGQVPQRQLGQQAPKQNTVKQPQKEGQQPSRQLSNKDQNQQAPTKIQKTHVPKQPLPKPAATNTAKESTTQKKSK